MNLTSFEVQSVHGLKETFVVNPNGMVDTTKSHTNRDKVDTTKGKPPATDQSQKSP